MNTPIIFPPPEPTLKLSRAPAEKWAATLAEERRRLHEDQEALREREKNLRDYETRLRTLQAEIEAVRTVSPEPVLPTVRATAPVFQRPSAGDDPGLRTAWEKVHRAREILEAEQRNMRDDRLALRDLATQVKQREEAVAVREARLAEREALVLAANPPPAAGGHAASAVARFTQAPFNMARSVFGAGR